MKEMKEMNNSSTAQDKMKEGRKEMKEINNSGTGQNEGRKEGRK